MNLGIVGENSGQELQQGTQVEVKAAVMDALGQPKATNSLKSNKVGRIVYDYQ